MTGLAQLCTSREDSIETAAARLRPAVEAIVASTGAVRVRGLDVRSHAEARTVGLSLLDTPVREREGFAPRADHGGALYSTTSWPADAPLCLHHELSYLRRVPSRLVFVCLHAPASGGETVLADAAQVLADLPAKLVDRANRHGWQLRRNYSSLAGTDWPEAFGTDQRGEVERHCAEQGIELRWSDAGLHTKRRLPAVIAHPTSGDALWFNQLAFLNSDTMDPDVRDYLLDELGPDGLPFETLLGDGSPLGADNVEAINAAYGRCAVREPWRSGDVLVVDNLRTAHGRDVFGGHREVVLMMGDPVRPGVGPAFVTSDGQPKDSDRNSETVPASSAQARMPSAIRRR